MMMIRASKIAFRASESRRFISNDKFQQSQKEWKRSDKFQQGSQKLDQMPNDEFNTLRDDFERQVDGNHPSRDFATKTGLNRVERPETERGPKRNIQLGAQDEGKTEYSRLETDAKRTGYKGKFDSNIPRGRSDLETGADLDARYVNENLSKFEGTWGTQGEQLKGESLDAESVRKMGESLFPKIKEDAMTKAFDVKFNKHPVRDAIGVFSNSVEHSKAAAAGGRIGEFSHSHEISGSKNGSYAESKEPGVAEKFRESMQAAAEKITPLTKGLSESMSEGRMSAAATSMGEKMTAAVENISEKAASIKETVSENLNAAKEKIEPEKLSDTLKQATSYVKPAASAAAEKLKEGANLAAEKIPPMAQSIKETATEKIPPMYENLKEKASEVLHSETAENLKEKAGELLSKVKSGISGMMSSSEKSASEKVGELYEEGKEKAQDLMSQGKQKAEQLYSEGEQKAEEYLSEGKKKAAEFSKGSKSGKSVDKVELKDQEMDVEVGKRAL